MRKPYSWIENLLKNTCNVQYSRLIPMTSNQHHTNGKSPTILFSFPYILRIPTIQCQCWVSSDIEDTSVSCRVEWFYTTLFDIVWTSYDFTRQPCHGWHCNDIKLVCGFFFLKSRIDFMLISISKSHGWQYIYTV